MDNLTSAARFNACSLTFWYASDGPSGNYDDIGFSTKKPATYLSRTSTGKSPACLAT